MPKSEQKKYQKWAAADIKRRKALKKENRINIRLTNDDLSLLKEKAGKEGLPYQSLISSVLHKYVSGNLVDVNNLSLIKKYITQR